MKKFFLVLIILFLIILVSIVYNTLPRLELNGIKNMVISYKDVYQEPGVIVVNANKEYISKVKIDNHVNTNVIGNYYVEYSLNIGKKVLYARRNVKVIDDVSPIIELNGGQVVEVLADSVYSDLGFVALDEYDGDITDKVEILGSVDTSVVGEYVLTYKVFDNSGNKALVNRIVKVVNEKKNSE